VANTSISNLSSGAAVSDTDLFPDVQTAGVGPVKVTASQIATYVGGNLGNASATTLTVTANGAASAPPEKLTGTWYTGGTSTTTKPQLLIEPTGATSNAWNTNGTALGINAASGFGGNFIDLQNNGSYVLQISSGGNIYGRSNTNYSFCIYTTGILVQSGSLIGWSSAYNNAYPNNQDLMLTRRAAATLNLGASDAASPVAQTLSVQSVSTGTSNIAGANFTIAGSRGTGTGAGGSIIFQTAAAGSSGSTQNALAATMTIKPAGVVNLGQVFTVSTLPTTGVAAGDRTFVSDALAPTFLGTLTGGGTVYTPVFYNGTAWVAG
jgi:hypothetical protein